MHTTYCDGKATPEEMVQAAIDKGLNAMGFSGHSFTPFDRSYCMSREETDEYEKEIRNLAEKYKDKIKIYCGIEQDYYGLQEPQRWDYIIGSVHYIKVPLIQEKSRTPESAEVGNSKGIGTNGKHGTGSGKAANAKSPVSGASPEAHSVPGVLEYEGYAYIPMDETAEIIAGAADRFFSGNIYALTKEYFRTVSNVARKTKCDVIGHFDLVAKLNKDGEHGGMGLLFDESDPVYVAAWKSAADSLLEYDIPFEINTGGISKGYRTDAYPSSPIRQYIKERGGRFILSSDSHATSTLCYGFDRQWV